MKYKIRNKANQYIFRTDSTVALTSKENATVYYNKDIAETYLKKMVLFYGGKVEFYLEEIL